MKNFFKNNPKLVPVFLSVIIYTAIGLFIYISLANQNTVEVEVKEEKKSDESLEVHPASVYFYVNNGSSTISYYARLDNKQTVLDLIEYHIQKSGLKVNRTEYTYGLRIEGINNKMANDQFIWKFYDNDKEISDSLEKTYLLDEHTYKAVYTRQ